MTPGAVRVQYPFTGDWLVQNSPANRVPSHGTRLFALAHAIDLVPVDAQGRSARFTLTSLLRPEPPERFAGFGRAILAPVAGTVVSAHDGEPDHDAHRGFPSVGYALTQRRWEAAGWRGLAGNHVLLRVDGTDVVVALCHLRRGSIEVSPGDRVAPGDGIGACGNSGNSTEPHLHLQAMTSPDPLLAEAVPLSFPDGVPSNHSIVRMTPRG